jgi:hypothetical protein
MKKRDDKGERVNVSSMEELLLSKKGKCVEYV